MSWNYGHEQVCFCRTRTVTRRRLTSAAVAILVIFILAVLVLFWATLFHVEGNMRALTVKVVDFDGSVTPTRHMAPLVGPMVTRLAQQMVNETGQSSLGYNVVSPVDFDYNPMRVRRSVYNFDCHAAIVVSHNATALLEDAVRTGHSTYDPTGGGLDQSSSSRRVMNRRITITSSHN
jgi:hypothetical protein